MAVKASKMQKELQESVRQVWLAGLGALASVEEQGSKVLETLIERGEQFETRSGKQVEKVKGKVKDVAGKAGDQWGRIEKLVDDRVGATLQKLGIPTRKEVQQLTKRVEELTRKIERSKGRAAVGAKDTPAQAVKTAAKSAATGVARKAGKAVEAAQAKVARTTRTRKASAAG